MIPGNASPLLLATAADGAAAAADVATKSLRFNSGDSANLSRTPSSASNRKTWTWAAWVKRGPSSSTQTLFKAGETYLQYYSSTNTLYTNLRGGSTNYFINYANVYRDPSAWYHIVLAVDTTQATSSNRQKLYVNGVQLTEAGSLGLNYPPQNDNTTVNSTTVHYIGGTSYFDGYLADIHFIDGSALTPTSFGAFDDNGVWQAAEYSGTFGTNGFHLLDFANESTIGHDSSGNENDFTANNFSTGSIAYAAYVTASSGFNVSKANIFDGSTSTGAQTVNANDPINFDFAEFGGISVSSTLSIYTGKSGFKYQINDSGSYTTVSSSADKYNDISFSGTLNNLKLLHSAASEQMGLNAIKIDGTVLIDVSADNDVLFDVPTNGTQSDTGAGGEVSGNYATLNPLDNPNSIVLSNGNLDWEIAGTAFKSIRANFMMTSGKWYFETRWNTGAPMMGIARPSDNISSHLGSSTNRGIGSSSNATYKDGVSNGSGVPSHSAGDILMCAFDADAGKVWFGANGSWYSSGDPAAGTNERYSGLTDGTWMPAVTAYNSSGSPASINFGQRPFAYSAPSGFKALCTTNLPTPTIADGSDYFEAVVYAGNSGDGLSTTQDVTTSFAPDLVWIKDRTGTNSHHFFDTIRGAGKRIFSNSTSAESDVISTLSAFNSDGFTVNGNNAVNDVGSSYISWNWDAGSSTVSNTDGTITSSVRANQTAGFSIVTYTGTLSSAPGTAPTVGHGLGAKPALIISKSRNNSGDNGNWYVNHSYNYDNFLRLNTTAAAADISAGGGGTEADPTSTVFSTYYINGSNVSGATYVAYCFAPVAGYSAFGSYEGNGATGYPSADGTFVFTGMRPRWILIKATSGSESWRLYDTARSTYNYADDYLVPSSNAAEVSAASNREIDILSNGFKIRNNNGGLNTSGTTYIYVAFAENPFQANGGLAR